MNILNSCLSIIVSSNCFIFYYKFLILNFVIAGLLEIIQNLSFVGCVDQKFALFQHNTKLYLGNTHEIRFK